MSDKLPKIGLEDNHQAASDIPGDLDFLYLKANLARIDVLIGRQVDHWQAAGQDPMDAFRGLYISDLEARDLTNKPFAHGWGHTAKLSIEKEKDYTEKLEKANSEIARLGSIFAQNGLLPRLDYLAYVFGLDQLDLDILLVCLSPNLDLRYERLFGYLQDDVSKKRPTVNLVMDLLLPPGTSHLEFFTRFTNNSPLFKYLLIEKANTNDVLIAQPLKVDETIVHWLVGQYLPHSDLNKAALLQMPIPDNTDEILLGPEFSGQTLASLRDLCKPDSNNPPPVVSFYGENDQSQKAAVRLLTSALNRSILSVDMTEAVANGQPLNQIIWLILRDARLTGAVPFIYHWEVCLPAEGALEPPGEIISELINYTDIIFISSKAQWRIAETNRNRRLIWIEFPTPSFNHRYILWEHFLGSDLGLLQDKSGLNLIAAQFKLNPGQIRDAVHAARDHAVQNNADLNIEMLFSAARAYSNPNLASLARKITPRFDWSDIILPADQIAQLTEIITTVRGRPVVMENWGVGEKLTSSQGITILFAGPPGTGKTMAAEVLARELGLDLYKIDLSTVVSKYIGETEKNLEKIFHEAASSNAILFFDEADAIFGKRSEVKDAHDRYANIEISYLLQRMEAYDGVTILATNLRANLDEAFTRRLQFAIDFPFPEEADRLRIWKTLFPPNVPRTEKLDFEYLSRRFKLAGGNIRNIIVSASFLAAADGGIVKMEHLLHGTRRELQKMGRLVED